MIYIGILKVALFEAEVEICNPLSNGVLKKVRTPPPPSSDICQILYYILYAIHYTLHTIHYTLYTILYNTILYNTILYYTILYYTILHYTTLYYYSNPSSSGVLKKVRTLPGSRRRSSRNINYNY